MLPETNPAPNQAKPLEPVPEAHPTVFGAAASTAPVVTSAPAPAVEVSDASTYDYTALSLYLVTMLSGVSVLISASYLVWNALDYFMKPAAEFSFFDLSSITIYALLYLVLFTTLYALASLRLEKRIKQSGSVERPLRTASAVWRALLIVWGVGAFVGLLYSPLAASLNSSDSSSIASEITSAIIGLVLIGLLFWHDLFVQKVRSGIVALGVIAGLAVVIAGVNTYASLNPKQADQQQLDYSSSMYNSGFESTTPRNSDTSESSDSFEYNFESTDTDSTTD